jgi:hypothetical protein
MHSHFDQKDMPATLDKRLPILQLWLIALSAFKGRFEFLMTDQDHQIIATTERAFQHLQRLIVADRKYRDMWKESYNSGEVECEKLGGVHLLWHGIWAFKVDAAGERTDLVMGNRIDSPAEMEQSAFGLVLTERKRASDPGQAIELYGQGRKQASLYAKGSLGGIELLSTRYVVVVTEKALEPPPSTTEDGFVYRHINIAVDPYTPSKAAKE